MYCLLFLSFVIGYVSGIVACGLDAPQRWQINDPITGFSIGAGARVAGAVDTIIHNGKEYINACDHGRELQMAVSTLHGECYNPTEAGSENDTSGALTSSRLLGLSVNDNILRTTIAPAFWMAPGQCEPSCGCALNKGTLSQYIMDKAISFNPFGIRNSFRYQADVHVPENVAGLQLESPTAYQTGEFTKFWTIDPRTGAVVGVPSPGEGKGWASKLPVCLGTQDNQHVMCALTPLKVDYYILYDFSGLSPFQQSTTKWSIVRIWGPLNAGQVLGVDSYICLGNLTDVQGCVPKVATLSNYTFAPIGETNELILLEENDLKRNLLRKKLLKEA